MKELFLIRDSLANKISYCHLLLFLASLPFDRFYSHLILISFLIHTLIQFDKQSVRSVFKPRVILLQSVFFITVLSTMYSPNPAEAYKEWSRQIFIFLFPVLFSVTSLDIKKYRSPLLLAFSLVCTAAVVYLYFDAFNTIRHYKLPFLSIFSASFANHNFSEPIAMHATFLSMQLAIALVYMLSVLICDRSVYRKMFSLFCACILSAGLIQLCSKSVFFCLFIIINLLVPFYLLEGRQRRMFLLITASLSLVFITGILKLNTFRERYINDLQADLSGASAGETSDPRLARWQAAGELIVKSPLTGYGAGSETGILQEVFYAKKYYNSFLHKLNAHNQYLSFVLKSGILGLLVYLSGLVMGFREAIVKKDLLFLSCMLLISFVSVSENLLDVDKGIIFYAFFFSFFMFSAGGKNEAAGLPLTNN